MQHELTQPSQSTGFAALVTAASAYVIWGSDVFPTESDPKGDPKDWTREELRRWLANVSLNSSHFPSRHPNPEHSFVWERRETCQS